MNIKCGFRGSVNECTLTTEHPASSYGIPVLVPGFALSHYMPAPAYGAGDLKNELPLVLRENASAEDIATIKAAGFQLEN
jgi:hypothetical protein